MRKLLILAVALLFASCSGDSESTDAVASDDVPESSTEAPSPGDSELVGTDEALPPLVTIPVSDIGADHINPPAVFDTSPSTGGDHYQFWQNCGFYTVPVIEGAATHTMEHGAVWITYNADSVTDADLDLLATWAADNGKLLISPYDHDDAIVLSAWGVQQRGVAAPTAPGVSAQITEFVDAWVDNPELAEAGVRCNGAAGVPPEDVRSFSDGQQVPAEFD